jgi:Family of unknown function (DUF5906)/Primase C terminal 2 (PriCT-2)
MSDKLTLFLYELGSRGNPDLVARHNAEKGKYFKERRKFGTGVAEDHLKNKPNYGVYLLTGNKTGLLVFDLDNHDGALPFAEVAEKGKLIFELLASSNLKPIMFRSSGGMGAHVWVAFRNPQVAKKVRIYAQALISKLGLKEGRKGLAHGVVEIFPKQDEASDEHPGSLIALPFGRNSLPVDPDTLEVIELYNFMPPGTSQIESIDLPIEVQVKREHSVNRTERISTSKVVDAAEEFATIEDALRTVPADDHDDWIKIGLILKGEFGDESFPIWHTWSQSSQDKYKGEDDSRRRWEGIRPKGSVRLGTLYRMARQNGWNGKPSSPLAELNRRYAILVIGGKTLIVIKKPDPRSLAVFEYIGVRQLFDLYKPEKIRTGGGEDEGDKKPLAETWFASKTADRFIGLEFNPDSPPGANDDYWNIWQGLAVTPKEGSWERFKNHIFEIIASGNEERFHWFLNWMALGVQKPGLVIGTVPVLSGLPGAGKGTLANNYGALFGRHYITLTQSDQITGRFNGHFFGKRFIFLDEGTFGGNRKDQGVLKTRITEDLVMMEQKGVDAILVRNRAIFMVASNNHSIVHTDIGDRRWMLADVSDKRLQDHDYFGAIADEMKNGGWEAMLHELLGRDISKGPNPRMVLDSEARANQMLTTAEPYIKMLHGFLQEGRLPQNWLKTPNTTTIQAMISELANRYRDTFTTRETLGGHINRMFPDIKTKPNGKYVVKQNQFDAENINSGDKVYH